MMNRTLLSIASRNVVRYGKRTVITAIVLMFGLACFIFFDSLLAGMDRMTIDAMTDYTASSIIIRTAEYQKNHRGLPLDYGIDAPEKLIEDLKQTAPEARGITPRALFAGNASNRLESIPILGTVVDPFRDATVFRIRDAVKQGSWLSPGIEEKTAVLGITVAQDLGLSVGDYFLLSARTTDEATNADEFKIVGIVDVPAPEINQGGVFISFDNAREFLGSNLPVTEIDIALPRQPSIDAGMKKAGEAALKIAQRHPDLATISIADTAKDYMAMRAMKSKFSSIVILVVILIAGVGIVNTILMSIYSRIKEIGVLRAYGMEARHIRRLFSLEGIMIGTVGSLGGALLGALLVWWASTSGIPLDMFLGKISVGNIPLAGTLYGEWHIGTFIFSIAFGILASWFSARIPAKKAASLEVTEALRFI